MTSAAGDPRSREVSQNVRPPERFGRHLCAVTRVIFRGLGGIIEAWDEAGVEPIILLAVRGRRVVCRR